LAKEHYQRDYILQKRPIILRSLLIVATSYAIPVQHIATHCNALRFAPTHATHCHTLLHTAKYYRRKLLVQHIAVCYIATHCNTLQHMAPRCDTLQHTAAHCHTLPHTTGASYSCNTLQRTEHTATHYASLRHSATHCHTMQHTATSATHCTLPHTTGTCYPCNTSQHTEHTATHCASLRHTAPHCCTLPHTPGIVLVVSIVSRHTLQSVAVCCSLLQCATLQHTTGTR